MGNSVNLFPLWGEAGVEGWGFGGWGLQKLPQKFCAGLGKTMVEGNFASLVMAKWLETLKLRLKFCLLLPLRGWHPLTPLPGGETRASVLPCLEALCPSLVFSWERFILLLVGGSALSWGLDPMLCQPGIQPTLPVRAVSLTGSGGHPWSYYPRNKLRRSRTRAEAQRRGWCLLARVKGDSGEDPLRPQGASLSRRCGAGSKKGSLGQLLCAHREAPVQRQRSAFPPLEPGQPPGTHSWPGACPPRAQSHPHLVNRTVPCSSGLRFTACQLCRISSGSGRSMLAQERKAGTLWARDRHRRCPAISEATRPRRTPGSPVRAPQPCRPLWRFWGPCSGSSSPRPAPLRVSRAAQPGADRRGRFKATTAPPPPAIKARISGQGSGPDDLVAWAVPASELHRNHGAGIEFDRLGQALHEPPFHKPLSNIS